MFYQSLGKKADFVQKEVKAMLRTAYSLRFFEIRIAFFGLLGSGVLVQKDIDNANNQWTWITLGNLWSIAQYATGKQQGF